MVKHYLVSAPWDDGLRTFWEVEVEESTMYTRFGQLGTDVQFSEEVFPTTADAQAALEKSILDKVRKGYLDEIVAEAGFDREKKYQLALSASSFSILASLARDRDLKVRRNLAANPNTPEKVMMRLLKNGEEDSPWLTMIDNPNTPENVLLALLGDPDINRTPEDSYIPRFLANRSIIPVRLGIALAQNEDEVSRHILADNPNTPAEALTALANDDDHTMRCRVAGNPNTPAEALTAFAKDDDQDVRLGVAENPSTPEGIVWQFARDDSKAFRQRLAESRHIGPSMAMVLASDDDRSVRRIVAENPKTPAQVLAVLAQDDDVQVRVAVAQRQGTPVEVMMDLARDHDAMVRGNAARSRYGGLPAETMMALARDAVTFVRRCVALNLFAPAEVLTVLANDDDPEVREYAMTHHRFPTPKLISTGSVGDGHATDQEFVEEGGVVQHFYVCECGWRTLVENFAGGRTEAWGRRTRHRQELGLGPETL